MCSQGMKKTEQWTHKMKLSLRLIQISVLGNQNVLVLRNGLVGNIAVAVIIANNI